MKRVPPSTTMKEALDQQLSEGTTGGELPLFAFTKAAVRLMLQVGLEQEVTEFLGRAHYDRGGRRREGWRNGYEPLALKSTLGDLGLKMPQVRETLEPFVSNLRPSLKTGKAELQGLAAGLYTRGLSTRDIQDVFTDALGERFLSRSAVSRSVEILRSQFAAWRSRDLSDLDVIYLFLDGQYHAMRQGSREKEGILCVYGVLESGKTVLIHLEQGYRESHDAWLSVLHDVTTRGLRAPLLIVVDGNPGLRKAVRQVLPGTRVQRCQVHKMRNILCKVPRLMQAELKKLVQQVFLAPDYATGLRRGRALIARFRNRYTEAMLCLEKDLEECLTYLLFPLEHRKRLRTTNLLERTFGESRRRTKVIPRFPTETSCLTLVYASLVTASRKWRGVIMTPKILRQLDQIRQAKEEKALAATA